jgi:hypothetical protein
VFEIIIGSIFLLVVSNIVEMLIGIVMMF